MLSVFAKEFVPRARCPPTRHPRSGFRRPQSVFDHFINALSVLSMRPGDMEDYLRPICELIKSNLSESTKQLVSNMVESLFQQSVQEPNFRYTGARVCQFFNKNLKDHAYFSGFLKEMMRRCQAEYRKRDILISGSVESQTWLRGLAMFMAEIFLNVEIESIDGTVSRLIYMPKVLTDFAHTLLSKSTEQQVKCCCQLLKLAGAVIEDFAKTQGELCTQFEDIFVKLAALRLSTELSDNTKILVGSVIKLKEQNWNRDISSPPGKSTTPSQQLPFQEGPVFYSSMGAQCTRREVKLPEECGLDNATYVLNEEEVADFEAWQEEEQGLTGATSTGNSRLVVDNSHQLDHITDHQEMGEEEEAAYEQFLQEQENNT